jgi:RNase P subunit RPR2
MNTKLSKTEAQNKISSFFEKSDFSPVQLKKIKRLAMKFNIKLGDKRKLFCKSCLHPLAGKITISKTHKTIECKFCGNKNKIRL